MLEGTKEEPIETSRSLCQTGLPRQARSQGVRGGASLPCPGPGADGSLLALVQIMGETLKDPVIKRCCEAPNRLGDLRKLGEGLEKCQKSLNDYLDSKRNAFPRFFFVSDDELLSILGSSDPLCVQEHVIKVGRGPGLRACTCVSV